MSSFEISSAIKAEATEIHALAALLPKDRSEWAHRIADRLWEQAKKLEERPEIFSVGEHAA